MVLHVNELIPSASTHLRGLPSQWVRVWGGVWILSVDLYSLVALSGDQSTATLVQRHIEDAVFCAHAARLWFVLDALELVATAPIPEVQETIVSATNHDR